MNDLRYAIIKTLDILNSNTLTFGDYSFTLLQLMFSFVCLSFVIWFIRTLFSDN